MLKRRDPVAIGNVGNYMTKMGTDLRVAKDKLINDVNSISEYYKGVDAEAQITQFTETATKLDSIIKNLESYGKYMKNISSYDTDNLDSTKQSFSTVPISTATEVTVENDIASQTFSLDFINNSAADSTTNDIN